MSVFEMTWWIAKACVAVILFCWAIMIPSLAVQLIVPSWRRRLFSCR